MNATLNSEPSGMFYGLPPKPVCCQALMHDGTVVHQGIPSHKIKVLVADDEQIIANTLTLILNKSGFEACAVYSGEATVQALTRFQPDVLISDVIMNGMTGVDAAIAVLSQYPNCKILLFSGQADTVDLLQNARTLGHTFELLAKPVHPSQILLRLGAMNDSLSAKAVKPTKRSPWKEPSAMGQQLLLPSAHDGLTAKFLEQASGLGR